MKMFSEVTVVVTSTAIMKSGLNKVGRDGCTP